MKNEVELTLVIKKCDANITDALNELLHELAAHGFLDDDDDDGWRYEFTRLDI